jgi:5-formyltetrahydrofolate cyclo-ligase
VADLTSAKDELRREMREMRRAVPDQAERSIHLWSHVRSIPAVRAARVVMVFDSIPGEPATESFVAWLRSAGKTVLFPEDDPPPDSTRPDVVIVPGIAFTAAGDRLGQGGGWYDRFLVGIRDDCVTIGVGFEPQLVDELPTEPHDVVLDLVITDAGSAM